MPSAGYFDEIFANAGTLTSVPDGTQVDGTVSYQQGYGILYSTPVGSGGYDFPRGQFNQILNDITTAIQAIQNFGVPPYFPYITANAGYGLYALTLYSGHIYQSLKAANTVLPVNDMVNWKIWDASTQRIVLTGTANFYVASSGNDANPGTVGSPWLTLQHAVSYILANIDTAGQTVNINIADATYGAGILMTEPITGGGILQLIGNTTTPANCTISTTGTAIQVQNNAVLFVKGFKIVVASSGNCLQAQFGGIINVNGNMNYGSCAGAHIGASANGYVKITSNYTISGNATWHWLAQRQGIMDIDTLTITLTGTPAFGSSFASVDGSYISCPSNTFSGSGTGSRYASTNNGVINTGGGGTTYLPGNSAGTGTNSGTSPYGLYV